MQSNVSALKISRPPCSRSIKTMASVTFKPASINVGSSQETAAKGNQVIEDNGRFPRFP